MDNSIIFSIVNIIILLINIWLSYYSVKLQKNKYKTEEYEKERMKFENNKDYYFTYYEFLLDVLNTNRRNYMNEVSSASDYSVYKRISLKDIFESEFIVSYDSNHYTTGFRKNELDIFLERIESNKRNVYMLGFKNLIEQIKSEVDETYVEGYIRVLNYSTGEYGYFNILKKPESPYYDYNRNLFDKAFKELKELEKLFNKFLTLKVDGIDS